MKILWYADSPHPVTGVVILGEYKTIHRFEKRAKKDE